MRSTAAGSLGRALTAIAVSFALSLGYLTVEALPARAADTVTIPDSGLAACVGAAIPGYSGGSTFNTTDVAALTTLDCSNRSIASLAGAENLTGISELNLSGNAIRNVAALAALYSLGTLDISNNHIADISPLMDLSLGTFVASGQTLKWAVEVNVPTTIPITGLWGSYVDTFESSDPAKLEVSGGDLTGKVAGGEPASITFSDSSGEGAFGGSLVTTVVGGGSFVEVPDAGFARCLDDALGLVPGSLFDVVAIRSLTSLNCDNRGIRDLTGAVALTNGTAFSFANNDIYSVEPLNGMPDTATLNISGNHISDLSLLNSEFGAGLDATGQTLSWAISPNAPTAILLKAYHGQLPETLTSDSPDLTIADGLATGTVVGVRQITFSSSGYGRDFAGVLTTTVDGGNVTVPDAGFAACLDDKLGVTGNVFGSLELANITSLDCSYRDIADLTGAVHLTGATSLDFSHNAIASAGPLGANAALTSLNLAYNKISTVNAVPQSKLVSINVSNNQIADVSPFATYPELTTIDASGQTIEATVEADTATNLTLSDLSGTLPTVSWPTGVIFDAGQVTAAAGIYSIDFTSGTGSKVFSGTLTLNSHADVEIFNAPFATCIAVALDKTPSTRIFSNLDLATVSNLSCSRLGIASIDGAQYLTGMTSADFSHNTISDLSPLADLPWMYDLDVSDNRVTDVSPLAELTTLNNLTLDGNTGVTSLSSLSGLTSMRNLKASGLSLTSLTGVSTMTSLTTLAAARNKLTSVTPILNVTGLSNLDVSGNQLTSLSELATSKATRLKTLKVSSNQLTSLTGLTKHTYLTTLEAANNKISDLTPLASLTKLLVIDLSNNRVSSLAGLGGLKYVVGLKLSGNQITDVGALSGYTWMATLDIYDNQLTDLSPLSGLSTLQMNATNQHPVLAVYPTVATDLPLRDFTGVPTLGTPPAGLSVDGATVTADAEGSYDLPFSSTYDTDTQTVEFSGTVTVKATYNTFTPAIPTITGTPKVDSTLTAHTGTWSPEPSFAYQWNADGAPISGATESTFVPSGAEVGKAITVTVTGTKDTYAATPVTSAATATVAQATFTSPDKVTVSGWYTAGETLTASATWTPTPDSISYTWLRDDVPIDGANAATYTLTLDDVGHSIAAQITVNKAGYVDDDLTSAAKAVAEGVTFPDTNLRACIAAALNSYPLVFTNQELASLTSLNCEGYTITDLTGADALTGLTSLNLRGNAITDFSPISSLTGLQSLNVSLTGLTNLDAFSHLTGLTNLDASSNQITDISGISGLTGLTTLDLSNNSITSLAPLSGLAALTTLAAAGNEISDLSPLNGLSALATPDLTGQNPVVRGEADQAATNPVQGLPGGFTTYNLPDGVTLVDGKFTAPAGVYSIPFAVAAQEGDAPYFTGYVRYESHTDVVITDLGFAGCLASSLNLPSSTQTFSNIDLASIVDLDCSGRGILTIEGAQYLATLASADFDDNSIGDLSPLADVKTSLTSLKVRDNALVSVAALADHPALQNLYLSGNNIADLSALSSAADLRIVDVSNNRLTNLDGLGSHAYLLSVTAAGNSLTDISALAALPRVTTIDVSNNQLTDLSALSTSTATTRLKTVTISGNRISSISVLSRFTKLATLRAANNKISDLTSLTGLTQLLEVDVTNNQVTSLAGLSGHALLFTLKASGNQLTSVSPLNGLTGLNDVEIFDNHIADLSPMADTAAAASGVLNARGQTVSQTVVPQVATGLALKDASDALPTIGTLPDGVTVDAGAVTASSEGSFAIPFHTGDFAANHREFSGTVTLTAAYNTFTTATPTITGTAKVGVELTAHPGTWSPEPTFAYQWKADGSDIINATAATFTPTSAEEGKAITVTVTGTKDTYAAASVTSTATETVAFGTFAAPSQIAVSGTFAVGEEVTASAGTWSPAGTISYQWLRNGSAISGATDAKYTLTTDEAGKAVSVRVSASAPGYTPGWVESSATSVALGTMYGDQPVIVGTVAIGNTLNVGTGYWNPSPSFSLQWYRAGYAIDGATGYSYEVTAADVGKAITVAQTGTAIGYAPLTKLSDPTSAVPSGTLSTSTGASVDGTHAVGQTLTAQAGTWTPTPDSFSYQWRSDGDPISGATSSTYVLGAGDQGHVITVTVTAVKAGYTSASATSADEGAVAKGSFVTAAPTITGTPTFGHTLKATVGAWSPVATFDWQWLRNGSDINGATGTNYTLTTADIGKAISVRVVGSLPGYLDTPVTSEATAAVAEAAFTAPTDITLSGDQAVGKTLSVLGASWTPTPDSVSYRWLRDGAAISGATSATYVLAAADLGKVITVEVTAAKAGYTSSVVTSAAGDPVAANAFTADVPVISGSPVVGATLTVSSGGWSPVPSTLSYQWRADGADVADATQATFAVTPAQQGKAITVTVTGEAAGYADKSVTSAATAKVALAELTGSDSVSVSGTAVVGSTLTASDVSWTPTPDSVVFQWLRGGVAIDDANDQTYVLTAADKGKVITVSVTATKDGYRTVVLTSVVAAPVSPASFTADVPVITGSPVVGQTLTADFGNWTPVPSAGAIEWKRDGKVIDGATSDTYLVTSADVGSKLTVSLLGSLDGYADHTATSVATDTVTKASFTAPSEVTTSGTMQVGEFVTAQAGTWTPTPTSISYQWLRDGDPIEGATSTSSYLLTPADAGHVVTVTVTVAKDGYTTASLTSADGDAVAAGAFSAPKPTISGTPTVDETLTAAAPAWTPSPATISYQWLADGTPIEGATGLTHKLSAADLGKTITFAVTGTKGGYADATATSDATAAVAAATLTAPTAVDVTGDRVVGSTLSVDHGTWAPTPDSYSYRWLRDGVAIDNATKTTYTLTAADQGKTITAEVTASKAGYTDKTATSTDGETVAAGKFATVSPWISGNALVGSTLTANVGYWSPEPSAYTYQWNADGDPIPEATASTFTVTQAQAGAVISLSVTGSLDGYQTVTVNTGGTDPVPAAEFTAPSAVVVTGDYVVGSTLTANAGTWSPVPASLTYQWMRGATEIADATGATYALTPADKGKVVTVAVTATSQGYRTTVLRSVAAEPVSPASFAAATPEITGTAAIGQTLTAEIGAWSPIPAETSLQWKRNGKVIEGATGATYTVGLDDATATLTVEVTGKTDGYADKTVPSDATATIAAGEFEAPASATVTGDLVVGSTLTADAGTWSPKPTLSYQWYRGETAISGADDDSYTLSAADEGAEVTVQVTGTAKGYAEVTIASVSAGPVVAGTIEVGSVAINGQGQVGRVLTAKPEAFSPTPTTWSYQWYRDGEEIPDATAASYQLGEDDNGHNVTVKVTGSRDGYHATAAVESEAVEVSPAGRFTSPEVAEVAGDFQVGHTLTASAGSWSPMPDSFSYQWLRSGAPIEGATEATYVMTARDQSKVITVKVTAKKAGYVDATVRSSAPVAVNPGSFTTTTPILSGVPQIGQTLSVNPGTWTPAATSVSYQWYRNGGAIPGANGPSYTVVAADVWTTISVNVTGARDGYATATTAASATPVPQGVLAGPNPAISGKVKVKKTLKVVLGTWSPSPDKVTYQWYRNGKVIKKATKASYKLTKSDKGKRITVKVTASKAGYATRVLTSAKTAKVKK